MLACRATNEQATRTAAGPPPAAALQRPSARAASDGISVARHPPRPRGLDGTRELTPGHSCGACVAPYRNLAREAVRVSLTLPGGLSCPRRRGQEQEEQPAALFALAAAEPLRPGGSSQWNFAASASSRTHARASGHDLHLKSGGAALCSRVPSAAQPQSAAQPAGNPDLVPTTRMRGTLAWARTAAYTTLDGSE